MTPGRRAQAATTLINALRRHRPPGAHHDPAAPSPTQEGDPMPNHTIAADTLYHVRAVCPSCGGPSIVLVRLDAVLTRTRSEAFLSVKSSAKKLEHSCDGDDDDQLAFDPTTGEVIG